MVHARGITTFGYFEASGMIGDEPASTSTRAKLFAGKGKHADGDTVLVKFHWQPKVGVAGLSPSGSCWSR